MAGGLSIIHGVGIVIGSFVQTRGPVCIYQGVTIGGNNDKKYKINEIELSQPSIGENTKIYANATLIGPLWIGDNVTIGAGSVITRNIDDNNTVYTKKILVEKGN